MSDNWHWRLVRIWLNGFAMRDKHGIAYRAYLQPGYEQRARTFLATALYRGKEIPRDVREVLSNAFDDVEHTTPRFPNHRKFELRFRRKGSRVDGFRQIDILKKMKSAVAEFGKIEAAISHLKTEYGLSRSEILKVWGEWKDDGAKGFVLDFLANTLQMDVPTHIENYRQDLTDKGFR